MQFHGMHIPNSSHEHMNSDLMGDEGLVDLLFLLSLVSMLRLVSNGMSQVVHQTCETCDTNPTPTHLPRPNQKNIFIRMTDILKC